MVECFGTDSELRVKLSPKTQEELKKNPIYKTRALKHLTTPSQKKDKVIQFFKLISLL